MFQVTLDSTQSLENGEGESNSVVTPRLLTETLFSLTSIPNIDPAEAEAISLEILFDAHHPSISKIISHLCLEMFTGIVITSL